MDDRNDVVETNRVESVSDEVDRGERLIAQVIGAKEGAGAREYAGEAPLTSSSQWPGLNEKSKLELDVLLRSMHSMAKERGWAPSRNEFFSVTGLNPSLYKKFFQTFSEFVHRCGYRTAMEVRFNASGDEKIRRAKKVSRAERAAMASTKVESLYNASKSDKLAQQLSRRAAESVFGERLGGCDMLHAPTNELGVVMLFGMMAKELGFVIELVRPGYPDCEAKRRGADGQWRRVLIEFEFESNRFDHDPAGCDLIVCWRHNARKSEVEVLELKDEMEKRGLVLKGGEQGAGR